MSWAANGGSGERSTDDEEAEENERGTADGECAEENELDELEAADDTERERRVTCVRVACNTWVSWSTLAWRRSCKDNKKRTTCSGDCAMRDTNFMSANERWPKSAASSCRARTSCSSTVRLAGEDVCDAWNAKRRSSGSVANTANCAANITGIPTVALVVGDGVVDVAHQDDDAELDEDEDEEEEEEENESALGVLGST